MNVENVSKFLSAKVKLMQEQIDKQQANIDKMVYGIVFSRYRIEIEYQL